jgi:excisionase family DNA binding protein
MFSKSLDTLITVLKYSLHMLGRHTKKGKRIPEAAMGKLHSIESAAEFLGGLSVWTIRRWLTNGKLPRVKVGSRTMLREADLIAIVRPETPAQAAARNIHTEGRQARAKSK